LQSFNRQEQAVAIKIHIHKTHRQFTNGLEVVEVEGTTVRDCLGRLVERFPDMANAIFDRKGNLINIVEVYVNLESAYPDELAKQVKDGDEIHLTYMLAGG
jgi:molybdopterin converting factor small subunit